MMGLTEAELKAMKLTGELANLVIGGVIGIGRTRDGDVGEFVGHIHAIQRMIMAQAAGRAYPDKFRLLGEEPISIRSIDAPTQT